MPVSSPAPVGGWAAEDRSATCPVSVRRSAAVINQGPWAETDRRVDPVGGSPERQAPSSVLVVHLSALSSSTGTCSGWTIRAEASSTSSSPRRRLPAESSSPVVIQIVIINPVLLDVSTGGWSRDIVGNMELIRS